MEPQWDSEDNLARIDALLERTLDLHSSPQIVHSILRLTRTPDYDVREVVACLELDPALATKILQVVNSSRFGLARKITNLRMAVAYLGQRALRVLALTFSIVDGMTRGPLRNVYDDYWRRALTIASAAGRLSAQDTLSGFDAYTAGLLADLGVLVLAQGKGRDYANLYFNHRHGPALVDAERMAYGFAHPALGSRLLERWEFPETLGDAARNHHAAPDESSPLEVAVYAGDLLADVLWTPQSTQVSTVQNVLAEHFQLDLDGFIGLAEFCQQDIQLNAEIFGVRLPAAIDCSALRGEANLLLADAEQDLSDCEFEAIEAARGDAQRHLGSIGLQLVSGSDVLRQGLDVRFLELTPHEVMVEVSTRPVLHERVQVEFRNGVQRFHCSLHGMVASISRLPSGTFRVRIEFVSPLREAQIAELRRAGLFDSVSHGAHWY